MRIKGGCVFGKLGEFSAVLVLDWIVYLMHYCVLDVFRSYYVACLLVLGSLSGMMLKIEFPRRSAILLFSSLPFVFDSLVDLG